MVIQQWLDCFLIAFGAGVQNWAVATAQGSEKKIFEEGKNIVKLQPSTSKKKYLRGKRVYRYTRASLSVPRRFIRIVEPYFKKDFDVEVKDEEDRVTVAFTHYKQRSE